jgi:hypothetical protein
MTFWLDINKCGTYFKWKYFMLKPFRKWVATVFGNISNKYANFRAFACGSRSSLWAKILSILISGIVPIEVNRIHLHALAELPISTNKFAFTSLLYCCNLLSVCYPLSVTEALSFWNRNYWQGKLIFSNQFSIFNFQFSLFLILFN